jgi:hypothetical protein
MVSARGVKANKAISSGWPIQALTAYVKRCWPCPSAVGCAPLGGWCWRPGWLGLEFGCALVLVLAIARYGLHNQQAHTI